MTPDTRPVTFGDLQRSEQVILTRLTELQTYVHESTKANAVHEQRLDEGDRHRTAMQEKLDNAGIDGTSGKVATWSALKSTIYFVVLALGGLTWLFTTFVSKANVKP